MDLLLKDTVTRDFSLICSGRSRVMARPRRVILAARLVACSGAQSVVNWVRVHLGKVVVLAVATFSRVVETLVASVVCSVVVAGDWVAFSACSVGEAVHRLEVPHLPRLSRCPAQLHRHLFPVPVPTTTRGRI